MTSPLSNQKLVGKAIEEGWRKQLGKVIAHVDLDAFYAQVEVKNDPERLLGRPVGVVQYNPFGDLTTHTPGDDRLFKDSNGSLIAVSYEARRFGVKRNMRGDEARKLCPDLLLVQVPTAHGKADLTHYRLAGKQVTDILARLAICEKASIDECFLDISVEARRRLEASEALPLPPVNPQQMHVCGEEARSVEEWYARSELDWGDGEKLLACGASAIADLRAAVKAELGFTCSAGVAHCKILAKLASGLHKPSQQTLVSQAAVPGLLRDLPIPRLRQLGGKFGEEVMLQLGIKTVGELAAISISKLESMYGGSQANWLHELSHGIDSDEVKQRTLPKSISCGKTFQGAHTLRDLPEVMRWLRELGQELEERVAADRVENAREPKLLTVHIANLDQVGSRAEHRVVNASISRSGPLRRPTADAIAEDGLALVKKWTTVTPGWYINSLSIGVSNFVAAPTGKSTLTRFFKTESTAKRRKLPVDDPQRGESANVNSSEPSSRKLAIEPQAGLGSAEALLSMPTVAQRAAGADTADAGILNTGSEEAAAPPQAASERAATGECIPPGVDPDVWVCLPLSIRRELKLQSMSSEQMQGPPARVETSQRRRPNSIAQYFQKK